MSIVRRSVNTGGSPLTAVVLWCSLFCQLAAGPPGALSDFLPHVHPCSPIPTFPGDRPLVCPQQLPYPHACSSSRLRCHPPAACVAPPACCAPTALLPWCPQASARVLDCAVLCLACICSGLPGPISPSALPPSAAAAVAHSNCRSSNGSGGSGDGRPAVGSSASQQRPNRSNTKVPPLHTVLLSRAAAILDAPLQGAPEAAATLVLPPGTPGCSNLHPIRGLQLAPSLCVAPRGRCGRVPLCLGRRLPACSGLSMLSGAPAYL